MEAAFESDHRRAPGRQTRELDRVLDRFGAGVEKGHPGRPRDRRCSDQPLGNSHIDLVRNDCEVGVQEEPRLFAYRFDHLRMGVTNRETSDSAREVDKAVAIDVGDDGAQPRGDHGRRLHGDRGCDGILLTRQNLARAKARNLCQ